MSITFDENSQIIKKLRAFKSFLTEIVSLLKDIFIIIKNHWGIVIFLSCIGGLYFLMQVIAFRLPETTIYKYFDLIDNQKAKEAWHIISDKYKKRWRNSEEFVSGYASLTSTKINNIKLYQPQSIVAELFNDKKDYEIEYLVEENFSQLTIYDTIGKVEKFEQKDNIYWLKIFYADAKVNELYVDSLPNYQHTLKLKRKFKKIFSIEKKSRFDLLNGENWKIYGIKTLEVSLVY